MLPRIRVSRQNPHRLETEHGAPITLIADTAWCMLQRMSLDDARRYMQTRQRQGFNMVWTVGISEFRGLDDPNQNGDLPIVDLDPRRLNDGYWEHVSTIVELAGAHGLYVGLLPTWGDKVTAPWGDGPRIFTTENLSDCYAYAASVAERLKGHSNLLWVLGGDRPTHLKGADWATSYGEQFGWDGQADWRPIWREMARGIQDVLGDEALITYHCQGGDHGTSQMIHDEPWLHMNTFQSGHGGGHDLPLWTWIARDLALKPPKPVMDAEINYEDHPVSPWPTWDPELGYFDDYDVRKQMYRCLFAGACGVVYGHHSVWQCAGEDPRTWVNHAKMGWESALTRPGAEHVRFLADLVSELPIADMVPTAENVTGGQGEKGRRIEMLTSMDHSVAAVYVPIRAEFCLDAPWAKSAEWRDPRTGKRYPAPVGETYRSPWDLDAVLVLRG